VNRRVDYDTVAADYDVRYRHHDYAEILNALTAFLGAEPADAILEVGCGTGHWLSALRGRARLIAGADPSAEMLGRAKGTGARLVRARAEALPWRDASFDRILCINALHHFSDRDAFFAESRRALRPGGAVFSVGLDPHARRDSWWVYDYFPEALAFNLERYPAVRTIRAEMVRAGFAWSESYEIETFERALPASRAFEQGIVARGFSSQLAALTDPEFDAGVGRIRAAMAEAAAGGVELPLVAELHLFVTVGSLGAANRAVPE
jgi:SAM-dependent methyltransferase